MAKNAPGSKNFIVGAALLGAFVLVVVTICAALVFVPLCRQTAETPPPQALEAPEQTPDSESDAFRGIGAASVGVAITEEAGDPKSEGSALPRSAAETYPGNAASYMYVGPAQPEMRSAEPSYDDPTPDPGLVRTYSAPAPSPGVPGPDWSNDAVAAAAAGTASYAAPSAPPPDAAEGIPSPSREEEYVPPSPTSYEVRFLSSN